MVKNTIYMWSICPCTDGVHIRGYIRGANNASYMPFCTSHVVERVGKKLVRTFNGSLYQLHGDLNTNKTQLNGIPRRIHKYFSHGFPAQWSDIVQSNEFKTLVQSLGSHPNESRLVDTTESDQTLPSSLTQHEEDVPPEPVVTRQITQEVVEEVTAADSPSPAEEEEISPMDITSVATSADVPVDPLIFGSPSAGFDNMPVFLTSDMTCNNISKQQVKYQEDFSSEDDDGEVYLDPIIYGPRSGSCLLKIKESDWEKDQLMRDKPRNAEDSVDEALHSSAPPNEESFQKSGTKNSTKIGKSQLNVEDSVNMFLNTSAPPNEELLQISGSTSASGSSSCYLDPLIFGPPCGSATIKIKEKDVVNKQLLLTAGKTACDVIKEASNVKSSTRRRGNASKSKINKENIDDEEVYLNPPKGFSLMKIKELQHQQQQDEQPITIVVEESTKAKTSKIKQVAKNQSRQHLASPPNSSRLSTKSKKTTPRDDDDAVIMEEQEVGSLKSPPANQRSIEDDDDVTASSVKKGGRRKRKSVAEISSDDDFIMTEGRAVKSPPPSGRTLTKQRLTVKRTTEIASSAKKGRTRSQRRKIVAENSDDIDAEPPKAAAKLTKKGSKKTTKVDDNAVIMEEQAVRSLKSPPAKQRSIEDVDDVTASSVKKGGRRKRKIVPEISSDDDDEVQRTLPLHAESKEEAAEKTTAAQQTRKGEKKSPNESITSELATDPLVNSMVLENETTPPTKKTTTSIKKRPATPHRRKQAHINVVPSQQQQQQNLLDVSLSSIACSTYQESVLHHPYLPPTAAVRGPYASTPLTKRSNMMHRHQRPQRNNNNNVAPPKQQKKTEPPSEAAVESSPAAGPRTRLARRYKGAEKDGDDVPAKKVFAEPRTSKKVASSKKQPPKVAPAKSKTLETYTATAPPTDPKTNRKRANKNDKDEVSVKDADDDEATPSPPLPKKAVASSAKSAEVAAPTTSKKETTTRRKAAARKGKTPDEEDPPQPSTAKSTGKPAARKEKTQTAATEVEVAAHTTSNKTTTTRRKPATRKTREQSEEETPQPSSATVSKPTRTGGRTTRATSKQPVDPPQAPTTKKGRKKPTKEVDAQPVAPQPTTTGGKKGGSRKQVVAESVVDSPQPTSTKTKKGAKKATAKKKPPPAKQSATTKPKRKTTFAAGATKKSKNQQKLREEKKKTEEMAARITDALKGMVPRKERTARRVSGQDFYQDIPDMSMYGEDDTIPEVPTTASSVLSTPNSSRAESEKDLFSFTGSSDQSSNFNFDAVGRHSPKKGHRRAADHNKSNALKADKSRAERVCKRVMNDRKKLKKGGARLKPSPAPKSRAKRAELATADMFKSAEEDDDDEDDNYFW